jgi:hypothetical protein
MGPTGPDGPAGEPLGVVYVSSGTQIDDTCKDASDPCADDFTITTHCPEGHVPVHVHCSKPKSPEFWPLARWNVHHGGEGDIFPYYFRAYFADAAQTTVLNDPTAAACTFTGTIIPFTAEELSMSVICVEAPAAVIDD